MNLGIILTYSWLGCLFVFTAILVFNKKKYITIYNSRWRLSYVLALVLSRSISYTSVVSVLMWYFTYYEGDLVMSAVLSNIQESLSSLFVIFMAHAADSFIGRFRTLLFSTTAYIGGLMLLWMFNPYDVKWLLMVIIILLALGTSGDNVLYDVILDMVDDGHKSQDRLEKDSRLYADVIWRVVYTIGSVSATLLVVQDSIGGTNASWTTSFLTCMIAMTVALMIFCKGHDRYHQGPLTKRPAGIFFRVCCARIQNFHPDRRYLTNNSRKDLSTQNLDTEVGENEQFRQPRRLDINVKEEGRRLRWSYTKEDIRIIKSLLRMFPMWGLFIAVSLVSATGNTFFLEQYSNLNTAKNLPIQIYDIIQVLSGFAMRCVYRWICGSYKNDMVKIGVGMLCGIICCVFAWQLEIHRLKGVHNLVDEDQNTSISFLWLVPQFCVLGWMEELTGDGLLRFYKLQIQDKPPINTYGEEYIELVQFIGKLVNILLILKFKRVGWIRSTINESRLDKYYILFVCVCSANLIIYFCTVMCFYNRHPPQVLDDDDDDDDDDGADDDEPKSGLDRAIQGVTYLTNL